ncbi:MAG: hypothetical protein IKB73_03785, partial [Ruminococcus sp.]|nr:hypothetical protein [Ruminococcus sp.]
MKNFTKLMAVVMCIIIALSSAACSLTPQWSYKTGDTELNIGVYIYALYNAYTQAETLAQETEGYDAEKGTYNGETSFLNVEITDEDGKKATADQWIQDEADEMLRSLLAVETEFERLGATLDEATVEGIKTSAKESWEYGPYYAMYGEQYKNPYKDIFEPLGVSYESFEYFYISSAKQQEVFERLYGEGGEKEVSTDDLTVYFKSNYTSYTYFNTNLYETVESTADSADAAQSLSKALPKKTINEYEDLYKGYAKAVNQGTDIKTVTETFVKDFKLESDPS